jgi:2-polyprenyl-3-methyl-5-hydroxy-6-metoxy-1,4-benzoquinol methylase
MAATVTPACYLCGGDRIREEAGRVRDNEAIKVLACRDCGLIFLSSFSHLTDGFYEHSGMRDGHLHLEASLLETAPDDERRFRDSRELIAGRRLLDVGCGNGGFLLKARQVAKTAAGVEPETALSEHFSRERLTVYRSLEEVPGSFDVITLFHVLEHIADPRGFLLGLKRLASSGTRIVVEVPNADDALLRLYRCEAFARFTYWSCHLFSFTADTLGRLCGQAGATVHEIKGIQRYSPANHLYWLACGKPGGHKVWSVLDSPGLAREYEKQLAAAGMTDTLLASLSFPEA